MKNSKKVLSLAVTFAMSMIIFVGCGGGGDETVSLRLSEVHSGDGHPAVIGHNEFARLANENSNGSLNVQVFPGGVLGSETEVLAQVQAGAIEMLRLPVPVLTGIEERFNALFLPGIWQGRDPMFRALDGEIGALFTSIANEHGLHILAWHDAGARSIYNSVRPIYTPADLAGLRIRMQEAELMIQVMASMGGVPVPMPPGEVYSAIQTGLVDGAENNWPSYVTSFSHYEVAPFFTDNEHVRAPEALVISLNVWNGLSAEQQRVLQQAALDGAQAQRTAWAAVEIEAEAQAVAAGAVVTRLTPAQRQAFNDLLTPMWDDWTHLQYYIDRIVAAQ